MNFRKVPTRSFQENFYSLAGPFLINGPGLHWSYHLTISTKPPKHRNQGKRMKIFAQEWHRVSWDI